MSKKEMVKNFIWFLANHSTAPQEKENGKEKPMKWHEMNYEKICFKFSLTFWNIFIYVTIKTCQSH